MTTMDRKHWLASSTDGFDLYKDHKNLILLFDPTAYVPDLTEASLWKFIRWAVTIIFYTYDCIHISGMDNIWYDLMTRWTRSNMIRRLVTITPLTFTNEE